jgi:hypothetical protein
MDRRAENRRGVNRPFEWTFTRAKLNAIFEKITRHEPRPLALVA